MELSTTAERRTPMKHTKKMIAPAVITILMVLYYVGIAAFFMADNSVPGIARFLMIIIPLLLSAVMIGVFFSRIKEIKGGEEDDLSNY